MSREVLVDTSALIAFFIKSELHHLTVKRFFESHPKLQWIVLSTVFDETVTLMRARVSPKLR